MNAFEVNEIKTVLGFDQGEDEELTEILKQCHSQSFLSNILYVLTNYKGIQDQKKKDELEGNPGNSEMLIQFTEDCNVSEIPRIQFKEKELKSNFLSSYNKLRNEEQNSNNQDKKSSNMINSIEGQVTFSAEYNSMIKAQFKEDVKEENVQKEKEKDHIEIIESKQSKKQHMLPKKNKNKHSQSQYNPNQNQNQIQGESNQDQGQNQEHRKKKKNNQKNKGTNNNY